MRFVRILLLTLTMTGLSKPVSAGISINPIAVSYQAYQYAKTFMGFSLLGAFFVWYSLTGEPSERQPN